MPVPGVDEVISPKHRRLFIQKTGALPNDVPKYYGQGTQYVIAQGISAPRRGGVTPSRVPHPYIIGQYRTVSESSDPPDDPTASIRVHEKHGSISFFDTQICPLNLYEYVGRCAELSDIIKGWDSYVRVYSNGFLTTNDAGDAMAWDSDAAVEITYDAVFAGGIYKVGGLNFGIPTYSPNTSLTTAVISLTYAGGQNCADCGKTANDGSKWILALTSGTTGAVPPRLLSSVDYGATFVNAAIPGGSIDTAQTIRMIGTNTFIILGRSLTLSGFWIGTLNSAGTPGTPTVVTTGFDASFDQNDLVVLSPSEIVTVGNSGYIQRSTDPYAGVTTVSAGTVTSQNLSRVSASPDGQHVVAVGAAGAVVVSNDRGLTWRVVTVPAAVSLTAVSVMDQYRFWVGATAGAVYYTLDGGTTWAQKSITGLSTAVLDMVFATDEVGYILGNNQLASTWNGGANWNVSTPRFLNLPTFGPGSALAVPYLSDKTVMANNVAFGGLNSGSTASYISVGRGNII